MAWWEGPSLAGEDCHRDSGEGSSHANCGGSFFRGHQGQHDVGRKIGSERGDEGSVDW